MPVVYFYLLTTDHQAQYFHFICQLLERCYVEGKPVLVATDSCQVAEYLDQLLWVYREDSFVPHALVALPSATPHAETTVELAINPAIHPTDQNIFKPPIQITYEAAAVNAAMSANPLPDILFNLRSTMLESYLVFKHIIEVVYEDATIKQLARQRFQTYRQKNCLLKTMKP